MTEHAEPPVVELAELLDDEVEPARAGLGRQLGLVVGLSAVGLAGIAVLAVILVPAVAEAVRWIVYVARLVNGA
ncbi:MAG: hypothetical protein KF727_10190 [Microbacteriaceae bacterium]|nr:hypothetical protein [Microbacteriaceae bacterium]